MMSSWLRGSLGVALLMCLHLSTVHGNFGPVYPDTGGNQIVPLSSHEIQLFRETVSVDLGNNDGWVKCRYVLRNLSAEPVAFSIAFVRSDEMTEKRGRNFRAWVEDRRADIRWMHADLDRWQAYAGGELDSLPVWELAIDAEDSVTVRCEYPVRFRHLWPGGAFSLQYFSYHTKAAALWAGVIESAEFEIDLGDNWRYFFCNDPRQPPYITAEITPTGYHWNGRSLLWRFENWEPSEDIRIGLEKTLVRRWQEYLEAYVYAGMAWYAIELPPYVGDSLLYTEGPLLRAIRGGFEHQRAAEPIAGNYAAFAHAYLEALRLEISARHGAPMKDGPVARFFGIRGWYLADPTYDRSCLNATELANERTLGDLQRRVAAEPDLLLPLTVQE